MREYFTRLDHATNHELDITIYILYSLTLTPVKGLSL